MASHAPEHQRVNSMNMPRDIIVDWQAQHERLFGKHAIKLQHRLAETGLFTRKRRQID